MKDDYIIAVIFFILVASLALGSFSQSGAVSITGAQFFPELVGAQGTYETETVWIVSIIAFLVAFFAFYKIYLKDHLARKRLPVSSSIYKTEFKPGSLGPNFPEIKRSDLDIVREYAFNQKSKGKSDEEVRSKLKAVGWDAKTIDKALGD